VPISSVVLSAQRVEAKSAIYNVANAKETAKNDAANPLVSAGRKLIPSVNRVFSTGRELYVYLQAYEDNGTPSGTPTKAPVPLIAYVSFYRDQKLVMSTPSIAVTPAAGSRLGIAPLSFSVALGDLPPGDYQCQVSILDPTGEKASFWRGALLVVK
jgi:hypothetical protein